MSKYDKKMTPKEREALLKAIKIVGGQTKLTRACNREFRQGYLANIILRNNRVLADRAILIEKATDGKVTRYDLRSDVKW